MIRAKRIGVLPVVVVLVAALLACKKNKEEEKTESTSAPSTAMDAVGVPECDDYLAKYQKCVSEKVPESARPQLKESVEMMRNSWKQAASNPLAKASLAQGCKRALETAKGAMVTYNCTW